MASSKFDVRLAIIHSEVRSSYLAHPIENSILFFYGMRRHNLIPNDTVSISDELVKSPFVRFCVIPANRLGHN